MNDNKEKPKVELTEELKNLRGEEEKKMLLESRLIESEDRFKTLFEHAPDGYYISDLEGNFIDGNKAAERIIGYNKEELRGKNYFQAGILSPEDIPKAVKALKRNKKGLSTSPEEFILQRKDKKTIEVEISTYPVKINGKMVALGIARDISKRKHLERALKKSEKEKSIILDSSPMHILYQNNEHKIFWANKAACDSAKKKMKEIRNKRCYEIWAERDTPCKECPVRKSVKTRKMAKGEMITPDGRYWLVTGIPVISEKGRTIGVMENTLEITELRMSQQKLEKVMSAIIETISKIIDTRDPYTAGHQTRVYQLSVRIAQELHLPREKLEGIRLASLIHDIGKIGMPSEILTKPSELNDVEFALMKKHPEIGYDILKDIDFPYPIAQIVLQHHERNDGFGYPQQLKEDEIFLEAKIIGVADVVEAMSSHRPYRAALGIDKALDEIVQKKGILYEPEVVDACVKLFKEKGFKFK